MSAFQCQACDRLRRTTAFMFRWAWFNGHIIDVGSDSVVGICKTMKPSGFTLGQVLHGNRAFLDDAQLKAGTYVIHPQRKITLDGA